MRPSRQDSVFWVLALLLVVVVLALGLEAYARLIVDDGMQFDLEMWKYARDVKQVARDRALGHEHRPGASAHLMGVDVHINQGKLRDREYPYERPAGIRRVLMLGDSVLFGWGVPADETVSKRLEWLLDRSGYNVEVINAGVGNYNTAMEVEYFFSEGYKYDPQVVVLNYFVNDAEPIPTYKPLNILQRYSYAYVWLNGRLDVLTRQFARRHGWRDYYLSLYDTPGWTAADESIARLAAYCRSKRIGLLIANYPELHELRPYPFDRVRKLVEQSAERYGAAYLDLYLAVRDEDPHRLRVTDPDPHPSSYAHHLFAQAMVATVVRMLNERPAERR